MPKRIAFSSILIIGASIALAANAPAGDSLTQVAGWKLADVGHKAGDDSDRLVTIEKVIPQIDLIYRPSESNTGGSIHAEFKPLKGCKGLSYNSGFQFDAPPADRAAEVREQFDEAFADFAKTCPIDPNAATTLMAGFAEAFAAVDKLMTDQPNVYPPEPVDSDVTSADQSST
ncbi:hypothetical protein ACVWZA_003143 [Sphingomonas sp. UYAg733]